MKQPLLKKIANQSEEIQQRACQSFLDILFSKIIIAIGGGGAGAQALLILRDVHSI